VPAPAARRAGTRVTIVTGAAIVAIPLLMWAVVQVMAGRAVDAVIASELTHGERLLHRVQRDRFDALLLTARLIASFPELRALFATDPATIRDYLLSYQQQNPGTPALIAAGPDGAIVGRTDDLAAGAGDTGIRALFEKRGEPAVIQTPGGPHHAAMAAADVGGTVFGYIVAVSPVDDAFAASIREATQSEVVLLSETGVVASTLRGRQDAGRSLAEWQGIFTASGRPEVTIASRPFVARGVRLSDRPILDAILLASRDDATAPFRRLSSALLIVGLVFTAAAAAVALWIARRQTGATAAAKAPGT
jgi:hypothetical protein